MIFYHEFFFFFNNSYLLKIKNLLIIGFILLKYLEIIKLFTFNITKNVLQHKVKQIFDLNY